MRTPFFAPLAALLFVSVGCSSSSSSNGGTTDSGGAVDTWSGDAKDDPANCVPPGTKPNELGMGGYCSPGGGECLKAGPDGGVRICTADVPDVPAHAWFCTYPCTTDGECGTGAYCATDPKTKRKGCVPNACKLFDDAGTDSATD